MRTQNQPLAGTRVLLVEEARQSAKLASFVLTTAGANVRAVTNGADALLMAREFEPRLIVLDLVLPDTSGIALMRALRSQERTRDVVLAVVTAQHGAQETRDAFEAGCAVLVGKPIDTETFADTIATALKEKP